MTTPDPELLAMIRAAFPLTEDDKILLVLRNTTWWTQAYEWHRAQVAAAEERGFQRGWKEGMDDFFALY
jgi:hypothetical protein